MCPCTPSASSAPPVCPDCILKTLAAMEPEAQALLLMANPALMLDHLALGQYLLNEMPQIHKQQQLLAQQQHLQQLQLQQSQFQPQTSALNREFYVLE
ncbi:unnamed protein product, partial [Mesorhabditis belari]|uniref:Uncharacterized protein n=1 Tax=Mesorhabditis belari TaxID=2138241 RepID=A0AAF3EJN9_9BILA